MFKDLGGFLFLFIYFFFKRFFGLFLEMLFFIYVDVFFILIDVILVGLLFNNCVLVVIKFIMLLRGVELDFEVVVFEFWWVCWMFMLDIILGLFWLVWFELDVWFILFGLCWFIDVVIEFLVLYIFEVIFCVGGIEFKIFDLVNFGIFEYVLIDLVLLELMRLER